MMFSREREMVFFMPPRTGTTTLSAKLRELGFIGSNLVGEGNPNPRHLTYQFVVKNYPEFKNYKMYGFFRDPEDRFLSVLNFCNADKQMFGSMFSKIFLDNLVSFKPQVDFLVYPNVTVLDFKNFQEELEIVFGKDAIKTPVLKLNSVSKTTAINSDLRQYVRSMYKEDYELSEKVFGRRIAA
jgi:hypothetical protein